MKNNLENILGWISVAGLVAAAAFWMYHRNPDVEAAREQSSPPANAWSAERAKLEAESVVTVIVEGEKTLRHGAQTGNKDQIESSVTRPLAEALRKWNEQRLEDANPNTEKYASCHLAALDFQRYVQTYIAARRDQHGSYDVMYRDSLKSCKDVLASS